jgi:XTP/dITP diphosphohydrolase
MRGLTYSFLDPWSAPRLGASGKKIWVAFRGITLGYMIYLFFGYAANMMVGLSPVRTWQVFHLFPLSPGGPGSELASAIWTFGLVAGLLSLFVASVGVAKITYRELKGDDFYGGSDAWRYALEHGRSTIGAPVALGVLFLAVMLVVVVIGLVGRIPGIGPILFGLLAFPAFLAALLGVFVLLSLYLALLYTPAVIGTTGEDALEGAIQAMGLLWATPWRTVGYSVIAGTATLIATWVLAVVVRWALSLIGFAAMGMGEGFHAFAAGTLAYLPNHVPLFADLIAISFPEALSGLLPPAPLASGQVEGVAAVGSFLGGVTLLGIVGIVKAYFVSSLVSGTTAGTYEANARKKATAAAKVSGLLSIADDSGIEVEALEGIPGVRSARFAGEDATDEQNNTLLLNQLQDVPDTDRGARFVCVAALAAPAGGGLEASFRGEWSGRIAFAPAGEEGFGYDPVFLIPEEGRTVAQLGTAYKRAHSHRSQAFEQAAAYLRGLENVPEPVD